MCSQTISNATVFRHPHARPVANHRPLANTKIFTSDTTQSAQGQAERLTMRDPKALLGAALDRPAGPLQT
jgi:hypothetical protein